LGNIIARLLSNNGGLPRDVTWQGRTVHIRISKTPIQRQRMGASSRSGRLLDRWVRRVVLGNRVVDLRHASARHLIAAGSGRTEEGAEDAPK
jgi:hypothetical protein